MTREPDFSAAMRAVRRESRLRFVGGVGIYSLPALSALPGFDHGFSARAGGVSDGHFTSLNLSFNRPEEPGRVLENYRRFCAAAGIPFQRMVMDNYAHGTSVLRVDAADAGKGYLAEPLPQCDGLVTNDPTVTLSTGHADCMAFFCIDPVRRCIGLAHAGWRGALGRIGANLLGAMREHYGSDPANVRIGVGPSICPRCFEVGSSVAEQFAGAFPDIPCVLGRDGEKDRVDLWMVACKQFLEAGARSEHISLSGVCTVETPMLYSHRRDKGQTGGMAAYLRIL